MKKLCTAVFLCAILLFSACAPTKPASVPAETAPTAAPPDAAPVVQSFGLSATPEAPAPTLPPTPSPTATPLPTAVPAIPEEWYVKRGSDLVALLRRNGGFSSEAEIASAVARMEIDPDKPMVALTFDDGPTPGVTGKILDVLEKYNGRATFFVVGSRIAGNEGLLRRAVALGCEIGNHTWDHIDLKKASESASRETVERVNQAVLDATGYTVVSLRPPEGSSNDSVKALAGSLQMSVVFWSHSTHDYRMKSASKIAGLVFEDTENNHTLSDGDIVLMHDLRDYTADAMEEIVSRLVAEGYQLVTVQELLHLSPDGFMPGKSYKRQ